MPSTETIFKVFISSPSDLKEERKCLKAAIEEISLPEGRLRAVMWEDDLPSITTEDAQAEINKLLKECDIVCGVFKSRFGSPTERFDSGTVEEIELNIELKRPVMLYFLETVISSTTISDKELEEIRKIKSFKEKYQKRGIYHDCSDIDEVIKRFLKKDIEANIKRILSTTTKTIDDTVSPMGDIVPEVTEENSLWYTDRISSFINSVLEKKHLQYTYIEDITFYENLLLSQNGSNYMASTVQRIMEDARVDAFNIKYGNYDYSGDIRAKFPCWAKPILNIIETAFPRRKTLNVLDVGGNYGVELEQIFNTDKYSCDYTIVDISNEAIARGINEYPDIKFVQANMEDFYLDTKPAFDICLCLRAIESRGVFRNAALIQMSKNIKPGGMIFVSIPNGYIDENGNIIRGLYDHRTRSFLTDRPIILAKKVYVKLRDYGFTNISILSLDTEILIYAKKED